jgi:hypothetical protein
MPSRMQTRMMSMQKLRLERICSRSRGAGATSVCWLMTALLYVKQHTAEEQG